MENLKNQRRNNNSPPTSGASLSYTKKGQKSAEKLLMVDSACYDAYLALGVENYLLGTKPAPLRWLLRAGGANTNRDEGLRELELTAERGQFLKPFAKLLLAVPALRSHDAENAKLILSELHRDFPHNLLYDHELALLETNVERTVPAFLPNARRRP